MKPTEITIRYAETDQMGVVHHGNYAQYLEIARIDWLDFLGFPYYDLEKEGIMLPVVQMVVNYKKPIHFGDTIFIHTKLKAMPTAKVIFDFDIYNQNKELTSTACTTLVFINSTTRKPIVCPEKILNAIKKFNLVS